MEISKALSQRSLLPPVLCPTNSSCLDLLGCQPLASAERAHQALLGLPSLHCSLNRASRLKAGVTVGSTILFPFSQESWSGAAYCPV